MVYRAKERNIQVFSKGLFFHHGAEALQNHYSPHRSGLETLINKSESIFM